MSDESFLDKVKNWWDESTSSTNDGDAGEAAAQEAAAVESESKGDAPWWQSIDLPTDVMESVSSFAFGDYNTSNYASGPTNATKVDAASAGVGNVMSESQGIGESIQDKLTGVGDWIKKNPKATDVILGMIASAAKGSSDREVADRNARSRIEEQNNAARLKEEDRKRISQSVTGIKRPARGMLPQYLLRKDGSRVFQPDGKLTGN